MATAAIDHDLSANGKVVENAEARFELKMVDQLADELPVCIAYRMPLKDASLSSIFKNALHSVAARIQARRTLVGSILIYHSRFQKDTAGSFPASTLILLNDVLKEQFPGIKADYHPVPSEDFKRLAVCDGKDTIFADFDHLTCYKRSMPSDLTWSGGIHIGDVLFVRIDQKGKV
jgi:hypothetical protein